MARLAPIPALFGVLLALPAQAAEPGGSQPPGAVPPNGRAGTAPMVFQDAPVTLRTDPVVFRIEETVADVAVKQEGRHRRFTLAADVLFDFDKANLRPEADVALRKFMTQLGTNGAKASLQIEGHTDGKGSDAYNDRLSMQRAESVQTWLGQAGGLPRTAMATTGFGKHKPVAPNTRPDGSDDPDGRQRNRRVEIVVKGI